LEAWQGEHLYVPVNWISQTNQHDKQMAARALQAVYPSSGQQRNLHTLFNDTMKLKARPYR